MWTCHDGLYRVSVKQRRVVFPVRYTQLTGTGHMYILGGLLDDLRWLEEEYFQL